MGAIASQITSLTIAYSTVYSDADQRKHQSSASLAFVRGLHRGPVNSPHKWPVTRKMFPFDDVIMLWSCIIKYAHILLWFREATGDQPVLMSWPHGVIKRVEYTFYILLSHSGLMETYNWVSGGSDNGVLPDSTKALPDPACSYNQWGIVTSTERFHARHLSHQLLKYTNISFWSSRGLGVNLSAWMIR